MRACRHSWVGALDPVLQCRDAMHVYAINISTEPSPFLCMGPSSDPESTPDHHSCGEDACDRIGRSATTGWTAEPSLLCTCTRASSLRAGASRGRRRTAAGARG